MADKTLRWDQLDGGRLGAVIECHHCDGLGGIGRPVSEMLRGQGPVWTPCQECSGSGELFRAYEFPEGHGGFTRGDSVARLAERLDALEQDYSRGLVGTLFYSFLPPWFVDMARATQRKVPTDG